MDSVVLDRKLNPQVMNAWGRIGMSGPPAPKGPILKEMTKGRQEPVPQRQKVPEKLPHDLALSILLSIEEGMMKGTGDELCNCVSRIISRQVELLLESKKETPEPKVESTYESWQPHFFSYMSDEDSDGNFCYYEKSTGFDIEVVLKAIWYTPIVLFPFGTGNEKVVELPEKLTFNFADSAGITGEVVAIKGTDEDGHPCLMFPDSHDWKSMKLPIKFSLYP